MPDERSAEWEQDAARRKTDLDLEGQKQDQQQRRVFAYWLFGVLCLWLAAILVMLFFQGFSYRAFTLSDEVLIAALATTTINVIGLFVIVARYLFPKES